MSAWAPACAGGPLGPLQADLGYGLQSHELRLHLRLGYTRDNEPRPPPQPLRRSCCAPQPTPPRRNHRVLLALELLLAPALALLLALWWWAGSSGSLASTLSRATHYLPEGQSLENPRGDGLTARGRAHRLAALEQPHADRRGAGCTNRLAPVSVAA